MRRARRRKNTGGGGFYTLARNGRRRKRRNPLTRKEAAALVRSARMHLHWARASQKRGHSGHYELGISRGLRMAVGRFLTMAGDRRRKKRR